MVMKRKMQQQGALRRKHKGEGVKRGKELKKKGKRSDKKGLGIRSALGKKKGHGVEYGSRKTGLTERETCQQRKPS